MTEHSITILHFNDVYNIEPQKMDPAGGAARMVHYVKSQKNENPLVLFSGDILNPSLLSIFLKGQQMIPVLNSIGVQCAVFGNHDFDFGVDHLEDFVQQTSFPWLISNITDRLSNEPLAKGKVKHLIEWHGAKVGVIGLVEEEWIATLSTIDPADIIYEDFVEVGNRLATELREEGADFVIALTHMRWPNDRMLAEEVTGVDIVLGGHDHDFTIETVNGKYILKSGTDFRYMGKIILKKTAEGLDVKIEQIEFNAAFPEDEDLKAEIHMLSGDIDCKMNEYLGSMGVPMDGRFGVIRTRETNLGNFVTDIILEAVPADICLMNSGTFRSDRIHDKGDFLLRDLLTILPMVDMLVVIEIAGQDIPAALENGVSRYPKLEGRFPQVSGISFVFDPSKPPGHRVVPELVKVQGEYVIPEKIYRLCTKEYLASGKDGYDVFKNCPVVIPAEQCPAISTAVRNHFDSVQMLRNEKPCRSGHRQSLCSVVQRSILVHQTVLNFMAALQRARSRSPSPSSSAPHISVQNKIEAFESVDEPKNVQASESSLPNFKRGRLMSTASTLAEITKDTEQMMKPIQQHKNVTHAFMRTVSIHDVEAEQVHLCPKVEGRIVQADEKMIKEMLAEKALMTANDDSINNI